MDELELSLYRGNAAATPPSTAMTEPVVLADSSDKRKAVVFATSLEVTCISMHAHTLDGLVDARFERVVGSQHGVCKSRLSWVTSRYLLSAGSTLQSGLSRRYGRLTQVCVFVREKNISSSVFVCVCMNLCSRIPRIHA